MHLPIVTLWKAGRRVDFNASDLADMLAQGWQDKPEVQAEPIAATVVFPTADLIAKPSKKKAGK